MAEMPDWLWRNGAADAPTRREADYELRRREPPLTLEIRPLDEAARDRYRARWASEVRADLLVNPASAVEQADALVGEILRDRGYPVDELALYPLTVDQARVLRTYHALHQDRAGADVFAHGHVLTDDLRHAVQEFRHLFDTLVESTDGEPIAG
jgi:hypothetical protein